MKPKAKAVKPVPKPVDAWGVVYRGRISPWTYDSERQAAITLDTGERVIPVRISPITPARAKR